MLPLLFSLRDCFRARAALQAEILALRHQLLVLQRSSRGHRLCLGCADRVLWVLRRLQYNCRTKRTSWTHHECHPAGKNAVPRADRLGDRCRERFTIRSWCLRRSDSAARERTPPGPSSLAGVARKWIKRTTRWRMEEW